MPEQFEAREFSTPPGRWYLTAATTDETDQTQQFLSEDAAKAIAALLNRPIPMSATVDSSNRPQVADHHVSRRMKVIPWAKTLAPGTADDMRMAQAIVDSDAVLRVYAATEWDCLDDDGKLWLAAIVREAQRLALVSAQGKGMFESGYIACWSDTFMKDGSHTPPITDAVIERAWDIYLATREATHTVDCASFLIASPGPCDCGYGEVSADG